MASIVLSSVGSSLGNALLPGLGGQILGAAGRKLGAPLDEAIGWSNGSEVKDGARLENFKVQDSRYGLAIPLAFGSVRVAGNVIWVSDLIETPHQENTGGGKGGVSGVFGSSSRTTYSYSLHVAIALGEGPIGGVRTIWADSKVIYQDGTWVSGVVGAASFYLGDDAQEVDPLMESYLGAGEVPSYQGIAYVVLESLQLAGFGNRLPNLTFELVPEVSAEPPEVTGADDPACWVAGSAIRSGAMKPIVIEAGSLQARRILTGGFDGDGVTARFVVREVDVSQDKPVEGTRVMCAAFAGESLGGQSWAMDPAGRYVALCAQNNDAVKSLFVALYDVQKREFGAVASFPMGGAEDKQIVWLDGMRLLVADKQGDRRGVRVFMRSGTGVVALGFQDVWGAGSVVSRFPIGAAHFFPVADGVLFITGNASPKFTQLYARHLGWNAGKIVLGQAIALGGPVDLGTGSFPQFHLVPTGAQEWTAVWMTASDLRMMSFLAGSASCEIVRSWSVFAHGSAGAMACQAALPVGDHLTIVRRPMQAAVFEVFDVALEANAFGAAGAVREIAGDINAPTDFCAIKAGGGRVLLVGNAYDGRLYFEALAALHQAKCDMAEVVSRLLLRAGYQADDFDVSALAGVQLGGFVVSDSDTLIAALQWLQAYEPFDLIERDGRLVAQRRLGDVVCTLPDTMLGARERSGEAQPPLEILRARELALPVELTLDTLDAARDYEIGTQRARRMMTLGGARCLRVALPLVCGASVAKRIAECALYALWGERVRFVFSVPFAFATLEVGDVVTVVGYRVRIVRMERQVGVWTIEGVSALSDGVASAAVGEGGEVRLSEASVDSASRLYLMDLPALRSADDQAGFYVAVSGGAGWKGAGLWRSAEGVNFIQKGLFDVAATAGAVVEVPSQKPLYTKDMESVLKVQLYHGQLASVSEAQMLDGANVALCGGEILQFETATLVGPQLYELRGLLRGRMGSEAGIVTHVVGEDFVLLTPEAVQFLPCAMEDRGRAYQYRAVSVGGTLGFAQDIVMAADLRTLRPLAPVHVRAVRAGGDVRLSWIRRTRVNGGWCDHVDVPLGEAQELYDVEVMKEGAVVRLFEDVAMARVDYMAAQQVADFGVVPQRIVVRVFQKSALYGRGDGVEAEV